MRFDGQQDNASVMRYYERMISYSEQEDPIVGYDRIENRPIRLSEVIIIKAPRTEDLKRD